MSGGANVRTNRKRWAFDLLYPRKFINQNHRLLSRGGFARNFGSGEVLLTGHNVICYSCNKVAHMAKKCPDREESDKILKKKEN
jgi:hypothetical protein